MIREAEAGSRSVPGFAPITTDASTNRAREVAARLTVHPDEIGRIAVWCAFVAAAGVLVWPAFAHAFDVWATTEEFGFGFLVLPVAAFLVWWHWEELRRNIGAGVNLGVLVVIAALGLYLLAHRAGINALAGLTVVPLLWGIVLFLSGWRAARVLAFPIGFLAFGLALYRGLLDTVGFALQGVTAVGAADIATALGVPVVRDGLVLYNDQFAFIVAQPCSGMSSLVSLLALASLWVHLARGGLVSRGAVLLSVLPLVIIANITRVALVMLIAWWFGQEAALGFFHGASSLVLFGLALSGMLVVSKVVKCKAPLFAR